MPILCHQAIGPAQRNADLGTQTLSTDFELLDTCIHLLRGSVPKSACGSINSTIYTYYTTVVSGRSATAIRTSLSSISPFPPTILSRYRPRHSRTSTPSSPTQRATQNPVSPSLTPHRRTSPARPRAHYVPINAPNTSAVCAGGGPIFVASGLYTGFTVALALSPVNLTARGKTVRWFAPRVAATLSNSSSSGNGNGAAGSQGGHDRRHGARSASCGNCEASSGLRSGLHITREWCWIAVLIIVAASYWS
ncbi:hypothetical protein H4582DRAFT_2062313 [Lactarius indigo]|nr:hypothetical protein H4582DRAFT_2062313 [Lactarius indigo]